MKITILLFTALFLLTFQLQVAYSQNEKVTPTFKIVGDTKLSSPQGEKTVEYDPNSPNHLFISFFDKDGKINTKTQFLFSGKKFNLSNNFVDYINNKEIVADGKDTCYSKDGSIDKTFIYQEGKLAQQCNFYPNGQKQLQIPGAPEMLNGEYKIWYLTGQIYFSGNYKNNFKNGDFEQFNESGASLKKGVYQEGKLISGEPVVLDIIYEKPEVPARFEQGEKALDKYLNEKASEMRASTTLLSGNKFHLDVSFDKTGELIDINNTILPYKSEIETIKRLLKNCPNFAPATVESIPVRSVQKMTLFFSKEGIKMRPEENIYSKVDVWPEFPGGTAALVDFLKVNVKYPAEAIQKQIQGKVFVNYIVDSEGNITDARIIRGVHPLLDAEAVRVVNSMPKWKPGRLQGKDVSVGFTLPITFNCGIPPNQK